MAEYIFISNKGLLLKALVQDNNNNHKVYLNCKNYLNYKLTENKLKIHTVAGRPK